jgi:fused signal recognition particle receptor
VEELETRLLMGDVGVPATNWLLERLRETAPPRGGEPSAAADALHAAVLALLRTIEQPLVLAPESRPFVILMVGVNGTGKTTTIGKLARLFSDEGLSVLLAAGDTFRAGAIQQLAEWGGRTGSPVVSQAPGADPAAVVHDAVTAARARRADVVLADTAGRLHTAKGLMNELEKIKRVMGRVDPSAPHETLLVLDASQGQNALAQAREFNDALGVTGLVLTKLDGTAKGGILLAIARELALPVRFVATGEHDTDLAPFDADAFAAALLGKQLP